MSKKRNSKEKPSKDAGLKKDEEKVLTPQEIGEKWDKANKPLFDHIKQVISRRTRFPY